MLCFIFNYFSCRKKLNSNSSFKKEKSGLASKKHPHFNNFKRPFSSFFSCVEKEVNQTTRLTNYLVRLKPYWFQ